MIVTMPSTYKGSLVEKLLGERYKRKDHACEAAKKERRRKDYANQVRLQALRKGPLTSRLARSSPNRLIL
eukprot:1159595-Pelagomonas_calceolata.AAC.2